MTSIDICNLALSYLGNTRQITSTIEKSTEAKLCNRFYDITRQTLLELYPWSFAVKEAFLTIVANETHNTYTYVYESPDDCIRILKIMAENDGDMIINNFIPCNGSDGVDLKRIACDVPNAKVSYIADIQDIAIMPKSFTKAFAYALADEMVVPLSANAQLAQVIQQKSSLALDTAKKMCALEQKQPLVKINKYMDARR